MISQRRMVYLVGFFRNVVSLCQTSVESTGLSLWLSSTRISGNSPCGRIGCTSSSPNRRLNGDMLRRGQVLVAHHQHLVLDQRRLEGREVSRSSGSFRSIPWISAPRFRQGARPQTARRRPFSPCSGARLIFMCVPHSAGAAVFRLLILGRNQGGRHIRARPVRLDICRTNDSGPLVGFVADQFSESDGDNASAVPPRSAILASISGSPSPALISLLSFSMMSAGTPLGAPNPLQ